MSIFVIYIYSTHSKFSTFEFPMNYNVERNLVKSEFINRLNKIYPFAVCAIHTILTLAYNGHHS